MTVRTAPLDHPQYLTDAAFEDERVAIFGHCWLYAGLAAEFSDKARPVALAGYRVDVGRDGNRWRACRDGGAAHVATCGNLLFVSLADAPEPLAAWLGPFSADLEGLSSSLTSFDAAGGEPVAANWKILAENTLDDYHPPMVHPDSLYPSMVTGGERRVDLERHGPHSRWENELNEADVLFWDKLARRGHVARHDAAPLYRHVFIFPNFYAATFAGIAVILHRVEPLGPEASRLDWMLALPAADEVPAGRTLRRAAAADFAVKARAVMGEDIGICERVQKGQHFARHPHLLGAREIRIADFQDEIVRRLQQAGRRPALA